MAKLQESKNGWVIFYLNDEGKCTEEQIYRA